MAHAKFLKEKCFICGSTPKSKVSVRDVPDGIFASEEKYADFFESFFKRKIIENAQICRKVLQKIRVHKS